MEQPDDLLSTDALRLAPIHPIISDNETVPKQIDQNEERLPPEKELQKPHSDWQFNNFLHDIADGITGAELKSMKHFFQGNGGISEVILKEIETVLDLFTIMRTRRFLNRDNLIYLQAILRRIGRIDLVKQAVEYANTIGNVLHFYPASSLPENGFKYVKFHVEGQNFRNSSRSYVQQFRNLVAEILFVPAEFVIIAGVEPSCSLLITLMIPELYVTILEELLEKCNCIPGLKELSIDQIEIEKLYTIGDNADTNNDETEQQKKLVNIYQQLERKTKQLDDSELARLRLSGELKKLKKVPSDHKLEETSVHENTDTTMEKTDESFKSKLPFSRTGETQNTYERSGSMEVDEKMQLELQIKHLEERNLRLERFKTKVSRSLNELSERQSTRKRKSESDLKEYYNKKSKTQAKESPDQQQLFENNTEKKQNRRRHKYETRSRSLSEGHSVKKRQQLSNLKRSQDKRVKTVMKKEKPPHQSENETEKKQVGHSKNSEDSSSSSLKKYDTPVRKKNIVLRGKNLGEQKMQKLARLNTSVRKNTFSLYESADKNFKNFPTLEEINARSLYVKVNRLYPVIEDPIKISKMKEGKQEH